MREKVARAIVDAFRSNAYVSDSLDNCVVEGGIFDMRDVADAAIAAILAELETPSGDLIATCMEQWCMFPDEPDRDVIGIMQAAAAHLQEQTNGATR